MISNEFVLPRGFNLEMWEIAVIAVAEVGWEYDDANDSGCSVFDLAPEVTRRRLNEAGDILLSGMAAYEKEV